MARLKAVLSSMAVPFEVLFVNDGSTDRSREVFEAVCRGASQFKMIEFSRNFGQQIALVAGLDYARGNAVITLDGDLQHPPELIPLLAEKWRSGYQVVYTVRLDSSDVGWLKRKTSRWFVQIMNRIAAIKLEDGTADFRLLDRRVVDVLRACREHDIFMRGMVSWVGFRQIGITYQASNRYGGTPKQSLFRSARYAIAGITAFTSLPLHFVTLVGAVVAAVLRLCRVRGLSGALHRQHRSRMGVRTGLDSFPGRRAARWPRDSR